MSESCISSNLLTYMEVLYMSVSVKGTEVMTHIAFQAGPKQQKSPDVVTFCGEGQGQFTCLYMHLDLKKII